MVFPSIRCLTCKKRRVKCDALRPSCGRCRKTGRDCHWEDEDAFRNDFFFRSENAFASGQPRRPRKRTVPVNPPHRDRDVLKKQYSPSLNSMSLSFPVEFFAFHFWRENLTSWPKDLWDIGQEYGAAGARYISSCKEEPATSIELAVSAFSLVIFGRVKKAYEVLRRAESVYSRSITQLRKELSRLSNDTIDNLLVATIILSKFDNTMYGFSDGNNDKMLASAEGGSEPLVKPFAYHHQGTASLLQARQQRGYTENASLDRALRRTVIRVHVSSGQPVPTWLQDDTLYGDQDPALLLDCMMIKAASLRSRSTALFVAMKSGSIHDLDDIKTVIDEARLLDNEFTVWARDIPKDWSFVVRNSPRHNDKTLWQDDQYLFYDDFYHFYATKGHAVIWNRYRAVRILVKSIRMQLLALYIKSSSQVWDPFNAAEFKECQETIRDMAIDICRSTPFLCLFDPNDVLHEVDVLSNTESTSRLEIVNSLPVSSKCPPLMKAILLAWPISLVVGIEEVPQEQMNWLKGRLNSVHKVIGYPSSKD